jgi:hypothetical protein
VDYSHHFMVNRHAFVVQEMAVSDVNTLVSAAVAGLDLWAMLVDSLAQRRATNVEAPSLTLRAGSTTSKSS